jgi:hypothetical protein
MVLRLSFYSPNGFKKIKYFANLVNYVVITLLLRYIAVYFLAKAGDPSRLARYSLC